MAEEDKYEVLEKIGHGSFGVIRKVRRKSDGLVLCRKEISYVRMSQKEKEQLQAELSILKELRHPNIVAYYERDHIKSSQDLHLYMEYCGNGDLGKVIKSLKAKSQFAEEEFVWSVFSQLVSALYRCHYGQNPPDVGPNVMGLGNDAKPLKSKQAQYMILHRDLKPENVFLGTDNSVKLGDFGLSKILQSHDFASTYVGTPFYMSPEICGAERYTIYSDIWSLGCIVYELCAREPPFNAKTHLELIQKIKAGRVPRIPNVYSAELQKVIDSCLLVNPNNRPDTAQLLNLPIVKLMRKEQEVVKVGQQMKAEKEKFSKALKELNDKMARLEEEKSKARAQIDVELRKEWEIKARAEIDRQVQIEVDRLQNLFEEEVNRRVAAEVEKRLADVSSSNVVVRSSTPTMTEQDCRSLYLDNNEFLNGKSTSTLDSASDFPSQTDLSSLSLDSPETSTTSFRPQKRPSRTPFARAKTMFNQPNTFNSPMDVHMSEPSPARTSIALSLSPRRIQCKNIFADRGELPIPELRATITSEDEDGEADAEDDDCLPALPSPTRPGSAVLDPFKVLEATNRPLLKPTNPRLASAPNLQRPGGAALRARPNSTVPVVATSPSRRKSKMPISSETGSPTRKAPVAAVDMAAAMAGGAAANMLKAKKGGEEVRRAAMRKNLQGRTLVELAQGKSGSATSRVPSAANSENEDAAGAATKMRMEVDEPAHWDPEKDDMPSPFLERGTKTAGRGIKPMR